MEEETNRQDGVPDSASSIPIRLEPFGFTREEMLRMIQPIADRVMIHDGWGNVVVHRDIQHIRMAEPMPQHLVVGNSNYIIDNGHLVRTIPTDGMGAVQRERVVNVAAVSCYECTRRDNLAGQPWDEYHPYWVLPINGQPTCHACALGKWSRAAHKTVFEQDEVWQQQREAVRLWFGNEHAERYKELAPNIEPLFYVPDWVLRTWWTVRAAGACIEGLEMIVAVLHVSIKNGTEVLTRYPGDRIASELIDWMYDSPMRSLLPAHVDRLWTAYLKEHDLLTEDGYLVRLDGDNDDGEYDDDDDYDEDYNDEDDEKGEET